MSNILYMHGYSYRFIMIPVVHNKYIKGEVEPVKEQICLVGVKHPLRNRVLVHPLSSFILELKRKSYNSMRNRADSVTRFLNFVIENNFKYKLDTLTGLNVDHGTDYLNYLVFKDVSAQYRNSEDRNITKLYYYLASKGLLNSISIEEFT